MSNHDSLKMIGSKMIVTTTSNHEREFVKSAISTNYRGVILSANHGAGKFDPREMTLSSILYIIILEINNIILYWG